MIAQQSCLYVGTVIHQRTRPKRHRLSYRVFSLLVDLDELPELARTLRLFSYNRFNLFSFFDRDHADGENAPPRAWVERSLAEAGIELGGGAIRLLCYPRILGYVFNPLSVYFCHDRDDALVGLVYEVSNTFGERHTYVIPVAAIPGPAAPAGAIRQDCDKHFYVSPFMPVAGRYHFRVDPPSGQVSVIINYCDAEGLLLHAAFRGSRVALNDRTLLRAFFSHPLMTLKVMAGIHWEALKLWRKRVPLVDRPSPPIRPVTIVTASEP